jgi:hypothetical protein
VIVVTRGQCGRCRLLLPQAKDHLTLKRQAIIREARPSEQDARHQISAVPFGI